MDSYTNSDLKEETFDRGFIHKSRSERKKLPWMGAGENRGIKRKTNQKLNPDGGRRLVFSTPPAVAASFPHVAGGRRLVF
jgi:hypothetical protein